MYYVHWKSLFFLGTVFWILLCLTDYLSDAKMKYYAKPVTVEEIIEDHLIDDVVDRKLETELKHLEEDRFRFGWSLMLWNIVAFIVSFVFCSLAKTISWFVWSIYKFYRNRRLIAQARAKEDIVIVPSTSQITSRIPVLVSRSTTTVKSSESLDHRTALDVSCPDLTQLTGDSHGEANKACETIFRNKLFSQNIQLEHSLQSQCAKLREEMLIVQATSLKEHAALSRKLETVTREKRELSKQLAIANKENRAAKQQLEELLQEKTALLERLEKATKEFKTNTKTKKVALAKLEEVSTNVESYKQILEQVSRDKEIVENKCKLLECEYEKLKERIRGYPSSDNIPEPLIPVPEKDENHNTRKENVREDKKRANQEGDHEFVNFNHVNIPDSHPTVSQTEIDMQKIQMKILQLEKNLENFNPKKMEFTSTPMSLQPEIDNDNKESNEESSNTESGMRHSRQNEIGIQARCNSKRSNNEKSSPSPRTRSNSLRKSIIRLEDIQERTSAIETTTTEPESSSDDCKAGRIVSSSLAFQNFLRNLNPSGKTINPMYRNFR